MTSPASGRPWTPFVRDVPVRNGQPHDPGPGVEFWTNSHYLVIKRVMDAHEDGTPRAVHLSLRTVENDTRHDWREMQRVKNELCGPEWEAVELYPAESRLVDAANQFHLWCIDQQWPIGFSGGLVATPDQAAGLGATQRAFGE